MNFYEFNEKLKKEKLLNEQGFFGKVGNMIGQGFNQGADVLQRSMNQGFQQMGNVQDKIQMNTDAKGMKNVEDHLAKIAKQLGLDPTQLTNEIQAFVKKINELKSSTAPQTQQPQQTSAPPVQGDWSSFQV